MKKQEKLPNLSDTAVPTGIRIPRNIFIIFLMFMIQASAAFSQSIEGKIVDASTQEALSYANVAVMNARDSSLITGTASDEEGRFAVAVPEGDLFVRISRIGYEPYISAVTSRYMGIIKLSPSKDMLSEVVVTGNVKMFRMSGEGITADVQNTPLKNIGTLSDVIGQMPFVSKSDNSFTVLGKGSPAFYINNRLVRDNGELQRIRSNEIKKVTVVTNPGAEYDATVNSVIKIETYRPAGEGFSADLWTYNRYNSEWYTMDRASFNYRKGKLDIFAEIFYANMSFPKKRFWQAELFTEEGTRSVVSKRTDSDMVKFYTPKAGFNYMVNENHSFGVQYEYSNAYGNSHDYSIDTESSLNGKAEEPVHTRFAGDENSFSHYVNAYYNGQLCDWLNLKLDMDYKTSDGTNYGGSDNTQTDGTQEKLQTAEDKNYDLYAAKLTLKSPLWGGDMTYGAEGSYTRNEQNYSVTENDGIPGIQPNANRVKQHLYSAFVSYGRSFGRVSGEVGLRYEDVKSEYFEYDRLVKEQSRHHRRLFPSFRLSYEHNKDLHMELAYKNTVSRPAYQSLRSSVGYMGPYQYAAGNPYLQPAYTNSLTYTLGWKQFSLMGVYSRTTDYIAEFAELYLDNSLMWRMINIDKADFLTVSLNYNSAFGIWRPNYDISVDKNFVTHGNPGITYNKPTFNFNLRNGFSIKGWNFGADISGRTKGNSSYYLTYSTKFSWRTNVYVNTSFFGDKLLVGLEGIDIFDTVNDDYLNNFNGLDIYTENHMYRRTFMFSLTYRFNASPKRYKGSNASDEINRL